MTSQHIHRSHLIIAATWKEEKFRRLSNITKNFKKNRG